MRQKGGLGTAVVWKKVNNEQKIMKNAELAKHSTSSLLRSP